MSRCQKWLVILACSVAVLSGAPGLALPASAQQASGETVAQTTAVRKARNAVPDIEDLPDSPNAPATQPEAPALLQMARFQPPADDSSSPQGVANQTGATQAPPNQSTNSPAPAQRPVGTAAAEAPTTTGVAASEPAGVAIAPAKQHRARTIIIRTGAIIGAAVAVGVVVGLTEATSSKPPGAH